MRSSYHQSITYGDLIQAITFSAQPKTIIEFGILDGFSLQHLWKGAPQDTPIVAYDIGSEFIGNSCDIEEMQTKFTKDTYPNVDIQYGNFYQKYKDIPNASVDLLHIDIANDGDVYRFALQNYLPKLKPNGIMMLEGGSESRDEVEWMIMYKKNPIRPVLEEIKRDHPVVTFGTVPSITLIKMTPVLTVDDSAMISPGRKQSDGEFSSSE